MPHRKTKAFVAVALLLAAAFPACAGEKKMPDPKAVRAEIDALIAKAAQAPRLTPAVVNRAIERSISYGAPVYNKGDQEACYEFYAATAKALLERFGDEKKLEAMTPRAKQAIADLKAALARAAGYGDATKKAWAMRFAFDKAMTAYGVAQQECETLVSLGTNNLRLGLYAEAEDAFATALGILRDLHDADGEGASLSMRLAPLALSNARFAQGRFKEAAAALEEGLRYVPEWPTYEVDQRGFFGEEGVHEACVAKLAVAAQAAPDDAELALLLGHEYYFGGKKSEGAAQFKKVAELKPGHAGVKAFLRVLPDSPEQQAIRDRIKALGSESFDARQKAEEALEKEGRWAAPALLEASRTSQDEEVRTRAMALLDKLYGADDQAGGNENKVDE